jgi:precorrin-6B C5,15-methyltransferase / cobalt-precorrin-6B C5,C15-methyltransferase
MTTAWLDIVGIGEDGMAGLSAQARCCVEAAEFIVGGSRHHLLSGKVAAQRIAWPSPFDAMIDTLKQHRGKRLVVLVTGDPLWYSVGARITKAIPAAEIRFHPQLSAFQWAACRLGWSLADVETLTVHGRPAEQIIPYFSPGARMLVLTKNRDSPPEVAAMLSERGYGASRLTVLAALGGPDECRFDGIAREWGPEVPDFHLLAVECVAGPQTRIWPRTGLPDDAYRHDGKLTKQVVRAAALARLAPQRAGILWDIGAGCGSIGIEWMRAAPEARAIAIEPEAERRAMAVHNAFALGAPALKIVEGRAPEALAGLPAPDAVFIGGGVSAANILAGIDALKPFGRLVAHAVTLESETVLAEAYATHGGELVRISAQALEPVGSYHGWKPAMPVTQWFLTKDAEQ